MSGEKIIAYRLERPNMGGAWMYAGVTNDEVLNTLRCELESLLDLSVEERGVIHLVPYETTQEEIDALPEFDGW